MKGYTMKKQLLIISSCIALSACVTTQWDKQGVTAEQRQQDMRQCQYEAQKATVGIMNGIEAGYQKGTLTRQCMEVRGYRLTRTDNQGA